MRRVLVPLDGTELATSILSDARRLAGSDGTLVLIENAPAPSYRRGTRQADTHAVEKADGYLGRLAENLEADGATVETHVLVMGDPAYAIDEAAALYRADMIAVATHGRSPLGRLVRGSVAWKALAHSPVPVLLRHPNHTEHEETAPQHRRVMVPLDGSDYAERALTIACELAAAWGAELLLVRVIPVAPSYVMIGGVYSRAVTAPSADENEIRGYLARIADTLPYPASTLMLTGPVSGSLIDAVRTLAVTDVVVASHGRTGLSRVVLGSVTDYLVQHLHCPIIIVPATTPERMEAPEPDSIRRQLLTAPLL